MKIKFTKDYQGNKKNDVVDPGNDTWAAYLIKIKVAVDAEDETHKEKNSKAGPNGKK